MVDKNNWLELTVDQKADALLQLSSDMTDVLQLHSNLLDMLMEDKNSAKMLVEVQ